MKKKMNDDCFRLPIKVYIEHFIIKYKILSCVDLTILINDTLKPTLSFQNLQRQISLNLGRLKKEGKIEKVKPMQWKLIEKSYD